MLAAIGHRQPADEVGQPDVRRALLLGVLVQVVVELPRLVADPQVVRLVAYQVVEHHEVGQQDLVHPADRLEAVQVVLGRLALDVARLVGQQRAGRVDPLTGRCSTFVTGCWASQSISRSGCSLRSSSAIATSRWAWPSPIGEEMYSARLRRDFPRAQRRGGGAGLTKSRRSRLTLTGSRTCGQVARALEHDQLRRPWARRAKRLGARRGSRRRFRGSRAPGSGCAAAGRVSLLVRAGVRLGQDQCLGVRLQPPADAVLARLGRVRLGEALREEELQEVLVVPAPVVLVVLRPALVGVELTRTPESPSARAVCRRQGKPAR